MKSEDKAQLVRQTYALFERGEIEELLSLLSEDVTWELPDVPSVPQAGRRVGREQVREFFRLLAENQEPQLFEIDSVEVEGDKVIARGRYAWRVIATGKSFASEWTHEFTVRDGLVVAFVETTDVQAALAAYAP